METNANTVARTLKIVYGLVPIVAGLDKFTNLLTHWDKYLAAPVAAMLLVSPPAFMHVVGVIEIVAGLGVLFAPRIFSWVVAAWLAGIALQLVLAGYYDIAVRDVVMAVGAGCLALLVPARQAALQPRTA